MREELDNKHIKRLFISAFTYNFIFLISLSLFTRRLHIPMFIFYLFLIFMISFLTEIIVIKLFLRKNKPDETSTNFYISVFFANLLTFPPKQVIMFIFFPTIIVYENRNFILVISILIEVIPIILKCFINLKIYREFNRISFFEYEVENQTIITFSIIANVISAGLELIVLYGLASAVMTFA